MQGSRTFMSNLAARLPAAAPEMDFIFYAPDAALAQARELAAGAPNVRLRPIPSARLARLVWPFPARLARETDVFHCQYLAPVVPCVPCVVSLHDILHESAPQYYPNGLSKLMHLLYPHSARSAAVILTGSRHSREEIIRRYKVSAERVSFAQPGVDQSFAPIDDPSILESVRRLAAIPEGPYILFVGRLEPRKNLSGLLKAYEIVRQRLGRAAPSLVLAGERDPQFKAFNSCFAANQTREGVRLAGCVPQELLPALYSGAAVFAYPSFGEGFGLPVLEAMACGAPVVASSAPAVPEVTADAAWLVAPKDVNGLAEALCRVLSDAGLAAQLRRKGLERASTFSWDNTVRAALSAYRKAGANCQAQAS